MDAGLDAGLIGWDRVVAIEFEVVERCGDAKPAGHGGGLDACDAGIADDDYVAATHGTADEYDFEFDGSLQIELARAKEKYAGGTDVAGDQSDGKIFVAAIDGAESQGKAEGGSGIFALFGKNADSVSGHACETAHGIYGLKRHDAKRRYPRNERCGGGDRVDQARNGYRSESGQLVLQFLGFLL